jgi:ankyrin repeat protein
MQTSSKILKILPLLALLGPQGSILAETAGTTVPDAQAPLTPLHLAAQAGSLSQTRRLLDAGEQVDARDSRDMTPLHYAAMGGHIEVAGLLLDRGADPNARAQIDMTPLHLAAMLGQPEMTGLLARRGARTDARNTSGMTPLHLASDDKVVSTLVAAGADTNAKTKAGLTPLHTARQGSVARTLLDHGADMRIRNPQGRTAMELAAVESLEPAGLSIHSLMLGRLRGLVGQMPVTLTNISGQPIEDLVLTARSPACDIEAEPARVLRLLPGENAEIALSFTRTPSVPEGEHPIYISIAAAGRKLGDIDVRVDTRTGVTLEDRGMIRLAKGQIRHASSRWFYLVYASVPLLVIAAWLFFRKR